MQVGRLMGARIKLSPFLLVLLAFFAVAGNLEEAVLVFSIVFLHELGHTAASRAAGLKISEIELLPFGGVARLEGYPELDPKIETLIAWAGPLTNFLLAAFCMVFYLNSQGLFTRNSSLFFIEANLSLAFFNLIPVLPLDGGRIFRAKMTSVLGFRNATELASKMGMAAGIIMAAVGVWLYLSGRGLQVTLILVAGFLSITAMKEKKMYVYAYMNFLNAKQRDLERLGVMSVNYIIAYDDTSLGEVLKQFSPRRFHIVLVINRERRVIGRIFEDKLLDAAFKKGFAFPLSRVKKN